MLVIYNDMAKKVTNKDRKNQKHKEKRIYMILKDSFIETLKDEYLRTGLYNPMKFRDFLVIHMNYPVEEANEITKIYKNMLKNLQRQLLVM